jgi:hypothetical protein
MTLTGLKMYVKTPGVISLYEVGLTSENHKRVLFDRLTFENIGWQTVRFSKPFEIINSILVVHCRIELDGDNDTASFAWGRGEDFPSSAYVDDSLFSGNSNVTYNLGSNYTTNTKMLFCFECLQNA